MVAVDDRSRFRVVQGFCKGVERTGFDVFRPSAGLDAVSATGAVVCDRFSANFSRQINVMHAAGQIGAGAVPEPPACKFTDDGMSKPA